MWPFRKKEKPEGTTLKRLVAGLIIGGAIGSIVGKSMVEKHEKDEGEEKEGDDEDVI